MWVFVVLVDGVDYGSIVFLQYGWVIVLCEQVGQCGFLGVGVQYGDFVSGSVYL